MKLIGLKITLANYCVYRCKYCYVDTQDTGVIDENTLYRVLRYYIHQIGETKNIFFLGGEVLLNFEILEKALIFATHEAQTKGKKCIFFLTTSGIGITQEKIKILKKYNVNIGISIDGDERVHGTNRIDKNKNNTYINTINAIGVFNSFYSDKNLGYTITVDENTVTDLFRSFVHISGLDVRRRNISIGCVYTKKWDSEKQQELHMGMEQICRFITDSILQGEFYYYNSLNLIIQEKIKGLPINKKNWELHVFPNGEVSGRLFHQSIFGTIDLDPLLSRYELLNNFAFHIIESSKINGMYKKYIESLSNKAVF